MFRKITHIVLALFLLVSTTGVTISMHYCGGDYVSTSINKEAKSCCDGSGGCCENKTQHLELEDDYMSALALENNITAELEALFPILFVLSAELLPEIEETHKNFREFSPPPTIQTRLSLLQTYLC